jgi:hypothetical protein
MLALVASETPSSQNTMTNATRKKEAWPSAKAPSHRRTAISNLLVARSMMSVSAAAAAHITNAVAKQSLGTISGLLAAIVQLVGQIGEAEANIGKRAAPLCHQETSTR